MWETIFQGNLKIAQMADLRRLKKSRWAIFGTGFGITMFFVAVYVYKPAYFKIIELKLYDTFLSQVHTPPKSSAVAIVDIDEYSIRAFGQWPWPRYRVALLLKKIQAAGALAVGNDILFGEPDATSPKVLKDTLKRDLNVDMGFTGIPGQLMDNDRLLGDILSTGPFVLGYSFYFQQGEAGKTPDVPLPVFKSNLVKTQGAGEPGQYLIRAKQVVPPLPVLLSSASSAGFLNTLTDMDGVLRRVPMVISFQEKLYPHISLATLMAALGKSVPDPLLKVSSGGISSLKIGSTVIPLEANGAIMVNYRGPAYTFPFIPAAHLLQDRVEKGVLENKIVFLGSSAAGLMDIRVTPMAEVYPGVEVNATIVDNILSRDFIIRPDWAPGLELAGIFLWGVITTLVIGRAGARLTLPLTLVLGAGAWIGCVQALKIWHFWLSPLFALMVLAANFSLLTLLKFWVSEKQKHFFRSAFSKYVSKTVVDQISESPDKLTLDGEEKEVSIFFADIRGFTALSEKLTPTQVTNLLHDYFTPVTQSIIAHKGTLDKFIGDAVMCFWNAPMDVPDHKSQAVKAALDILDVLEKMNRKFIRKYGISIDMGIGVHSGKCRVGNMGSVDLFDYTIIGDNVNLTSRLEGLTRFYGVKLIVSKTIKESLQDEDIVFQELDLVRVKGKREPVEIFTVHRASSVKDCLEELSEYKKALEFYRRKDFEQGLVLFTVLADRFPESSLHKLYQARCAQFMNFPPEDDWDGVFVHVAK